MVTPTLLHRRPYLLKSVSRSSHFQPLQYREPLFVSWVTGKNMIIWKGKPLNSSSVNSDITTNFSFYGRKRNKKKTYNCLVFTVTRGRALQCVRNVVSSFLVSFASINREVCCEHEKAVRIVLGMWHVWRHRKTCTTREQPLVDDRPFCLFLERYSGRYDEMWVVLLPDV